MSNGGFMSNRLACDRADVFAAVAPVAGEPVGHEAPVGHSGDEDVAGRDAAPVI
ncbi:hypothetical protein MAHJHV54_48970 [Mycobacterium avium subsp. hominissuis]